MCADLSQLELVQVTKLFHEVTEPDVNFAIMKRANMLQ